MRFHQLVQKNQHFQAYCRDESQNMKPLFCEKSENRIYLAKYAPKNWTTIDREPIVVSIQKPDKFHKQVTEKIYLKRRKAEACQEREKNEIILTCP